MGIFSRRNCWFGLPLAPYFFHWPTGAGPVAAPETSSTIVPAVCAGEMV